MPGIVLMLISALSGSALINQIKEAQKMMDKLKELFGAKALTWEDFSAGVTNAKIKLADLSEGKYVDREKFDSKVRELDTANQSVSELTGKLKAFDGVDVAALKADVKNWETKYKNDLAAVKKDAAVDAAIMQAKGKNAKAIRALLDLDKVTLREDGTLEGLDLEALKKSDGYLFDTVQTVTRGNGVQSGDGNPAPGNLDSFIANARAAAGLK